MLAHAFALFAAISLPHTVPFEITSWEQTTVSEDGGVVAARADVSKKFAGALDGTSVATVLSTKALKALIVMTATTAITLTSNPRTF